MKDNTIRIRNIASDLAAGRVTPAHKPAHEWVGEVVREARRLFGAAQVTAGVWTYREQQYQYLGCDLQADTGSLSVSVAATGSPYFPAFTSGGLAQADVYDMAEATHLIGLITKALNAEIYGKEMERSKEIVMDDQKDVEIARSMAERAIIFLELDKDEAWATAYGIGRDGYEMPEELREHESLADGFYNGQQDFIKYKDRDYESEFGM